MIVSFLDCHVKPCLKQLHLTLAHKFYPHHQKTLEQLAKCINPGEACQWVAALYSRDMRFVHYQVLSSDIFNFLSPLSDSSLQSSCLFFFHEENQCMHNTVFQKAWLFQVSLWVQKLYSNQYKIPLWLAA